MSDERSTNKSPWAKKDDDIGKDNALWRLSDWFPEISGPLAEKFKLYHGELIRFNARLNLVSRTTEREADEVHFADCIAATKLLPADSLAFPIHDIGSGNGLPGIVIGMLNPHVEVRLVESDGRKCEFLKHIIHLLQIENVKVMNVRLETLKAGNLEIGISRGFASISKTLLACNRSFVKGGRFFHLKSGAWSREVGEIPSQLVAHWRPELVGEYALPVSQARRAVVCTTRTS